MKTAKHVIITLITLLFPVLILTSPVRAQESTPDLSILEFTGKRQLVLGEKDQLGRATFAHIQLQDKDEPHKKREKRLKYDPVGWHNYKFYYGQGSKKSWLMNRGHLVGYQFSGLSDEGKNLVPMTAYLNTGNYKGTDENNIEGMLYYENRLDSWLALHPNYWLDYQVIPKYTDKELLPRQIELRYVGLDKDGNKLDIKLGSTKEQIDEQGITHVLLDNKSANADIDYLTGRATNTVKKGESLASSQESQPQQTIPSSSTVVTEPAPQVSETPAPAPTEDRMVYVTGGGKSKVYWYGTEQMPKNTNKNNLITMPESQAIAEGRRHSKTEH